MAPSYKEGQWSSLGEAQSQKAVKQTGAGTQVREQLSTVVKNPSFGVRQAWGIPAGTPTSWGVWPSDPAIRTSVSHPSNGRWQDLPHVGFVTIKWASACKVLCPVPSMWQGLNNCYLLLCYYYHFNDFKVESRKCSFYCAWLEVQHNICGTIIRTTAIRANSACHPTRNELP